jgi:hypothetical protein
MNFNVDLYNKSEAKEFGEYDSLELGGHEIIILDAREYANGTNGNISLKVCVDVAGSDRQAGYYKTQYESTNDPMAKWPAGATKYLSLKDEQIAYLKGFITAIENSNPNFKFDLKGSWEQLKGKRLAGQFGLEEYEGQDGETKVSTKLIQFRSLDKLPEIKIPRVKLINGNFVEYEEYQKNRSTSTTGKVDDDIIVISNDQLPF